MSKLKWEYLTTIDGRINADSFSSFLQAHGIETELFQEGYGVNIVPLTIGPLSEVQIFVKKELIKEARTLLNEYQHGTDKDVI